MSVQCSMCVDEMLTCLVIILALFSYGEGAYSCGEKLQGTIIPRFAKRVRQTKDFNITFPGDKEVNCGNYLSALNSVGPPTVKYCVPCRCKNVTLLFVGIPYNIYDTDALVGYPYLHWLVHNVPSKILRKAGFNGNAGDVRTDFFPPINPFSDHQYTFFLYCQSRYIDVNQKKDDLVFDRPSFQPLELAENYDLGDPIAINYFISSMANGAPVVPSLNKVE